MLKNLLVLLLLAIFSCVNLSNSDETINRMKRQVTQCGVPSKIRNIIINGEDFDRGSWPWLVALIDRTSHNFFCGGVLVSTSKVITAAHCIQRKGSETRKQAKTILLLFGAYNLTDPYEPGKIALSPKSVIVHPDWDPWSFTVDADIAAIIIDGEVPYLTFIKPICIWHEYYELDKKEGYIAGWGKSEDKTKPHENIPKQLKVPISSIDNCNEEFTDTASNRTFCAGSRNGSGPCYGDSGSGLYVNYGDLFYLKGIASAVKVNTDSTCDTTNYAIYTNVDKFISWIKNPTENASSIVKTIEEEPACGIMNEPSSLIVYGRQASRDIWPWTAAIFGLEIKPEKRYVYKNTGTLLTKQHVICFGSPISSLNDKYQYVPYTVDRLKVYLGVTTLNDTTETDAMIQANITSFIIHPNIRDGIPKIANIGIIKLQNPISYNNFIAPACMSNDVFDVNKYVGRNAYGVGWGWNEAGETTRLKKYATMQIRNKEDCSSDYKDEIEKTSSSKYFCAGGNGNSIACKYDDPLYMKINGRWTFIGLSAMFKTWPNGSCSIGHSAVYEDIGFYSTWIKAQIKL